MCTGSSISFIVTFVEFTSDVQSDSLMSPKEPNTAATDLRWSVKDTTHFMFSKTISSAV